MNQNTSLIHPLFRYHEIQCISEYFKLFKFYGFIIYSKTIKLSQLFNYVEVRKTNINFFSLKYVK